jgi:hypothetical protein
MNALDPNEYQKRRIGGHEPRRFPKIIDENS